VPLGQGAGAAEPISQ